MKRDPKRDTVAIVCMILLLLAAMAFFAPPGYGQNTVAARIAAWVSPEPTRSQIVQASQRVFISESGFASTADENMIFRVFRQRAGSKRDDLRRQMRAIAAYSNRTFPLDSPFLPRDLTARTPRQRWISQVNLACDPPPDWRADVGWTEPRGKHLSYEQLCHAQRKRAWRLWQGQTPNWCQGRVDHWGGAMDMENPRNGGWVRVTCDDPAMLSECAAARATGARPYALPIGCTRNLGWCDPGWGACQGQEIASL
jgi:hypothetical protein